MCFFFGLVFPCELFGVKWGLQPAAISARKRFVCVAELLPGFGQLLFRHRRLLEVVLYCLSVHVLYKKAIQEIQVF